jgi:hypothetical protein
MFRIDYRLSGTGWAVMTVTHDAESRVMVVSYIGPSIDALVFDTAALLTGAISASKIEFQDEPGEHIWKTRRKGEMIDLRIDSEITVPLDEDWNELEDIAWTLEATVSLRDFAAAVLDAFDSVVSTYGLDGYKKKWTKSLAGVDKAAEIRSALASQTAKDTDSLKDLR